MELGYIAADSLGGFRSLLLPAAVKDLENGCAVALGVREDDMACGALAGQVISDEFHITSFYVAPAYRRRGFGRRLLQTLLAVLDLDLESPPVFSVRIAFSATLPEHDILSLFLENQGFTQESDDGQNIYLCTADQVSSVLAADQIPAGVSSFAQLDEEALRLAAAAAQAADVVLPEGAFSDETLDRDVSMAIVQGGHVAAFAAFDFSCGGLLTLASLWSGSAGPTAPVLLLRGALCAIGSKYPAGTQLAVQTINAASTALVSALLPEAKPVSRIYIRPLELDAMEVTEYGTH